jgi:aspartyl-tRNA(Asn)/glutamyl-tRNA(Gln) amidotransferase subunit A
MYDKTILEQAKALRSGEISSLELTKIYLNRINNLNSEINAFISIDEQGALEQAKQADQRLKTADASLLTGIPIAHKDLFCTKGIKTTCASRMLSNFIPPYESHVSEQYKQHGAVMLGKTNMDEFGMGSTNENSFFGKVKNPWDYSAIPGGSSGGSAAAVAAGMVAAATGSDTGGSIRQPASHCGITGIKPTYGRVSRYGMIAYASSLDQAGVMTKTAEDAAIMLSAIANYDCRDSTCANMPNVDYRKTINNSIEGLKIGIYKDHFSSGLNPDIANSINTAIAELKKLGATIVDIELPHSKYCIPVYYVIAPAEASSNLARFDGVHFGYRCDNPKDLQDLYIRSRNEGFGEEVKRRIISGTFVLSKSHQGEFYKKAQQIRRLIKDDFIDAFKSCDVIISPNVSKAACDLGVMKDPLSMYLSDLYTLSVNLAGLPAMSVPVGFSGSRPVGMQIIGKPFSEAHLLNIAHKFQQHTDWHQQQPTISEVID